MNVRINVRLVHKGVWLAGKQAWSKYNLQTKPVNPELEPSSDKQSWTSIKRKNKLTSTQFIAQNLAKLDVHP